jgi:quercetin dioxygenase-like cupin family protein
LSAEPITRVVGARGDVIHDCVDSGCTVSWDGYALIDGVKVTDQVDEQFNPVADVTLAKGERVPGHTDPDPAVWDVQSSTATLRG